MNKPTGAEPSRCCVGAGSQRGAVLLLAMVFLLLLAMIASAATRTSTLEFRMAGNDQFREEAFQKAQAVATALAEDESHFPLTGAVGSRVCEPTDPDPESLCHSRVLAVDGAARAAPPGVTVSFYIERLGPLLVDDLPFRQSEGGASSARAFDAALFETVVEVNGSGAGLGRAQVVEGVARRVPAPAG